MTEKNKNSRNILSRYAEGLYTRSEVENLSDIVKTKEGRQEISEIMDRDWLTYSDMESSPEEETIYKHEARELLNKKRKNETKKRFHILPLLKYAAVVAVLFLSAFAIFKLSNRQQSLESILYTSVMVERGEQKTITLPDGTQVILNAGTFMRYPVKFGTKSRMVEIEGEAYFDVTADKKKPFIVHTKDVDIKVLGTSFNVKAYDSDEELSVSVKSGKVQVSMPEVNFQLEKDNQLVVNKVKKEFYKKNINGEFSCSWISGGLHFHKTPINDVVKELERIYDCRITFDPNHTYDDYIYGEHDNKNLESVLKSIQYSTNIKYRKEGDNYILFK